MSEIVIDTNAYSFLCHGRMDVANLLSQYDCVVVPSVVLGELEAGFRKGTRYELNKAGIRRFLAMPCVRVADVDALVAETYGIVHADLERRGRMIPLNDVWIAATALALDAPFVTFDHHFENVEGLNLILLEE